MAAKKSAPKAAPKTLKPTATAKAELPPKVQKVPRVAKPAATADVVVIGGGHNGLVAAAYLARAGVKTILVEARTELGGMALTGDVDGVLQEAALQGSLFPTAKGEAAPIPSRQSVAVIVPAADQPQEALVAVVSPDEPTKVLQKPEVKPEADVVDASTTPEPAEKPAKLVSIDAVDYNTAGNIVFSGQGNEGNTARVYIDNNFIGDAQVGVEWDVRACGSFERDQGRWQRLCPGLALPR